MVPGLEYEPSARARPVVVELDGGVTRIVVGMRGSYSPVPRWVGDLDVLAFVVAPVWWVATLLVRTGLRAVFEVSGDRLRITMREPGSGVVSAFDWPRSAVAEVRANRYEAGLWIDVRGHVKETYLPDLPRETIERLAAALTAALSEANAPIAAGAAPAR